MSDRPVVLTVAGMGAEAYRRYGLESMAAARDVVLITGDEPSWEVPFIRDRVVVPDPTGQSALSAAGRTFDVVPHQVGRDTGTDLLG
ncbi:hypothetical protein [Streptomyces griseiscabiei]|uniref:Uncharacterized protein n=1 Tax=Streptomyces griseiscabiei TaxID=2993540 RepID=A0ABU4KXM2_9ACTN|nr:hypothetical protein [Streptomyces griseiscabiei]MDX2908210.1 hypothetical protein [Streptomyces griseiscabiei]